MNANEYQQAALRTESTVEEIILRERQLRIVHAMIGLCTETGELQDAMKKSLFYRKPLDEANIAEELQDCLWYIAIGLDALGVKMADAMERNIAKLRVRFPDKFTEAQALTRDLDAERKALEGRPETGMLRGPYEKAMADVRSTQDEIFKETVKTPGATPERQHAERHDDQIMAVLRDYRSNKDGGPQAAIETMRVLRGMLLEAESAAWRRCADILALNTSDPQNVIKALRILVDENQKLVLNGATAAPERNTSIDELRDDQDEDHALLALRRVAHACGVDSPRKLRDGTNKRIAELCQKKILDAQREYQHTKGLLQELETKLKALSDSYRPMI